MILPWRGWFGVVLLTATGLAAEPEGDRFASLGPLKRFDPYAEKPLHALAIYGDPSRGLTTDVQSKVQRISDTLWYLELRDQIGRIEVDAAHGDAKLREVIQVDRGAVISPDGKWLFGSRDLDPKTPVSECFDLTTGASKWTFETGTRVFHASFSPDGSQVAVLHYLPLPEGVSKQYDLTKKTFPVPALAVSWYDTQSGKRVRRVQLAEYSTPDRTKQVSYGNLAFSKDSVVIACNYVGPLEDEGDDEAQDKPVAHPPGSRFFIVKAGVENAAPVEVDRINQSSDTSVLTGGPHGDWVVFRDEDDVMIYRCEAGELKKAGNIHTRVTEDSPLFGVRFTPGGNSMILSSCAGTSYFPLADLQAPPNSFKHGGAIGDFTANGKYYVRFDDGGGLVYETATWEKVEMFESKLHPVHCCPVTEAGYSLGGNYIISSDEHRLLLWSKDGRQLAELGSPQESAGHAVKMQSPLMVEKLGKIYAADGWNFLEWSIDAIDKRLARKPDNLPRIEGTVVFTGEQTREQPPEVMNLWIDANGENIVTATRSSLRYRPILSAAPVKVPTGKVEFFMQPRGFVGGAHDGTVTMSSGSSLWTYDLGGAKEPVLVGRGVSGVNPANHERISIKPKGNNSMLCVAPADPAAGAERRMDFPPGWRFGNEPLIQSPDAHWVVVRISLPGEAGRIAVVDVEAMKITYNQSFPFAVTSLSLSADGKHLLAGGSNRVIYDLDFEKMKTGG